MFFQKQSDNATIKHEDIININIHLCKAALKQRVL